MEKVAQTVTLERGRYESMTAEIAEPQLLVDYYKQLLLCMKRRQFGVSSEKMAVGQITLFEGDNAAPPPESETEEIQYTRKKRKGKREADLSGLEVERIDYELPETERGCPQCGETMRDIGSSTRRELTLIPAKVIVTEHAAHSYACRRCEREGLATPIVRAAGPAALISGSLASASLVSHIAVRKYTNGMPLYRLEHGFRYDGVNVSRQTMANWVIICTERYLEPVYALLKKHLLAEDLLHGDETVVQVLREPGRGAQTKSHEWLYRTGAWARRKISIYE